MKPYICKRSQMYTGIKWQTYTHSIKSLLHVMDTVLYSDNHICTNREDIHLIQPL